MDVTVTLFHNGKLVKTLPNLDVEDMHKIIGILHYGGWKHEGVKYLVDDYHIVEFEPLRVEVNVQTEEELNRKTMTQMAGLSNEFKQRLTPIFRRQTDDGGESIN